MARERSLDAPAPSPSTPSAFPELPTVDLRIGRLALGRDETSGRFVLWAHEMGKDEDAPPDFVCQVNAEQAASFCDIADAVCAAGRPLCPLCGDPMDPSGHMCVRRNGHSRQQIPPVEGEVNA